MLIFDPRLLGLVVSPIGIPDRSLCPEIQMNGTWHIGRAVNDRIGVTEFPSSVQKPLPIGDFSRTGQNQERNEGQQPIQEKSFFTANHFSGSGM
ncbi:MAG: Uncharacterised protein [Flavobacteriia bacterium]|nr:MAG: Uncharacterised protein [Flavobacteriia bacterium]